ncbi:MULTISPECIES: ATP-binding cassette domain-containing protein [unclassified Rhizobium]|uniref:ABC transporter ATP-binding protein n=1 Tax=unclassified Rhizobium TaxID=2613769 RepID=UPI0006FA3605|nr:MULTISPECIES: ATP-binding cassette domain-containing protein [unclassified Rhizobium]KQV40829.1 amino acid transporter [Rhizobium sp. Root1212]KRD36117.1 amino acid transporter [Rhizobium sp. Root268]
MTIQTCIPAVEIARLEKSYGSLKVLHDISLKAEQGEVISILGASGSGKSTLLRCVNMLEVPNAGSVSIFGEEYKLEQRVDQAARVTDRHQLQRLRSQATMVFQSFNLWSHLTILENLIEAPVHVQHRNRKVCIAEAEALLERVGIADKRNAYPSHLSGGQQQRAAIARALAMHPRIMLFDEPTSALDPELVAEVLKVMKDLAAEGRTMLVVTHEMSFARNVSSRVVFLHKGYIEEDGTPAEVFSHPRSERFRQFISKHAH